jgi:hypothetical protein
MDEPPLFEENDALDTEQDDFQQTSATMMQRRLLEYSRHRLISKIENGRGSRVILLVHRPETMSFLGFPVYRYIECG